jgi:predicted DNA-binding transcriptional regulator AlpA
LSFLTKIRKVFHTTPILRDVSKSWASTFGMSKAYADFDAKIGISENGEPVPVSTGEGQVGFGQSDLADWASQRFPNTAILVNQYRESQGQFRYRAMPAEAPYGGDVGFVDGEENGGEFYDDDELS